VRTEFGQQRDAAAFGDELRTLRFGSPGRRSGAPRSGSTCTQAGSRSDSGEVLVVDAVDAERALLHHAFDFAVLARAVRAGPRTQLAADALVLVDETMPSDARL
jgi:hypothetical protein